MKLKQLAGAAMTALGAIAANPASATEILFAQVGGGSYVGDGNQLAGFVNALPGVNVTQRRLDLTFVDDFNNYDQIWVYDLSVFSNNNANQAANYQGIANWFNNRADQNLIVDGRIISSGPNWTNGNGMSSEQGWIQNYATQLDLRGGGLVLGTDHAARGQDFGVFVDGINNINDMIGIARFRDFYFESPFQSVVDSNSPLYLPSLDPCRTLPGERCINDNSSTSIAPSGDQSGTGANLFLTPVAYHIDTANAFDTTSVAATFGSITFGTCDGPGQPACDPTDPPTTVSEAAPLSLIGLGLAGLVVVSRRRRKRT
ncbi:MAG: hypothetical protein AAGC95_06130 [Pseudomonadota bacterium]